MSDSLRLGCQCGNRLAEILEGVYLMSHRGRVVLAQELLSVQCDACRQWHVLSEAPDLADVARERVTCACRAILGSRQGALWHFRHRARAWTMSGLLVLCCEGCATAYPLPAPAPVPALERTLVGV